MPADGGKREKATFSAVFKRLSQSRINEIQTEVQRRVKAAEAGEDVRGSISDVSLADEILLGWEDVTDGDGEAVHRGLLRVAGGAEAKKLIGAAEYWAGGATIDDTAADAALMGIELPEPDEPEHYEVEPDAWPALQIFLTVQTQWRSGPSGLLGLDYNAVRWVMELQRIADPLAVLDDLQTIEARVVEIVNERAE
jgi:hypothetical protein